MTYDPTRPTGFGNPRPRDTPKPAAEHDAPRETETVTADDVGVLPDDWLPEDDE